jgi:DNA processing protein
MITPDRRARMLLSCAIDGGDPAVAELVQNLGAEGAWAKIIEGLLGEAVAHRAARVSVDVFERLAAGGGRPIHRSGRRRMAGWA